MDAGDAVTAVAFPGIVDTHKAIVGVAYLAAYVALDRVSFIEPYAHFGITPWNPNTGLSFVLVLVFGLRMIPFLFIGPFLADLVNRTYRSAMDGRDPIRGADRRRLFGRLSFLGTIQTGFDPALSSMRDLVVLMLVAAASAAFVASSYVGLTIAAGLLTAKDFDGCDAALLDWGRDRHLGARPIRTVRVDPSAHPAHVDGNGASVRRRRLRSSAGIRHCRGTRVPTVLCSLLANRMDGGAQWDRRRQRRYFDHSARRDPGSEVLPG